MKQLKQRVIDAVGGGRKEDVSKPPLPQRDDVSERVSVVASVRSSKS